MSDSHIDAAIKACRLGGVIAYPTEAVFGLGCLPENETGVNRILKLKDRSVSKGLILVAAAIEQLFPFVDFTESNFREEIEASWPGPVTWLIPAKTSTPAWLTGEHSTLAVRVSAHPIVRDLCRGLGPIVSTSANPQALEPARSSELVKQYFPEGLDYVIPYSYSENRNPSEIRDGRTGEVLRAS